MQPAEVSQLPVMLALRWRAGDPVSLSVRVLDNDWTGTYTADVNGTAVTVVATLDGTDTVFVFTLAAGASTTLGAGRFDFQCRNTAGLTRFAGLAVVMS